ncbi:MAG: hypothetical protein AB7E31_02210 [Desulfitobacterium sp.]
MELDQKTTLLIKISAAAATNALASLRSAMTDAKALGVPKEILRQTVELALEIQQQPLSHTQHLTDQLLRETVKKKTANQKGPTPTLHVHGPGCGCGHHHHNN